MLTTVSQLHALTVLLSILSSCGSIGVVDRYVKTLTSVKHSQRDIFDIIDLVRRCLHTNDVNDLPVDELTFNILLGISCHLYTFVYFRSIVPACLFILHLFWAHVWCPFYFCGSYKCKFQEQRTQRGTPGDVP